MERFLSAHELVDCLLKGLLKAAENPGDTPKSLGNLVEKASLCGIRRFQIIELELHVIGSLTSDETPAFNFSIRSISR